MKTLYALAILAATCSPVHAGNVATFDPPADEQPMGGSNAAWIVPLIAFIAIAAASSGGDDESKKPKKPPVDPCGKLSVCY